MRLLWAFGWKHHLTPRSVLLTLYTPETNFTPHWWFFFCFTETFTAFFSLWFTVEWFLLGCFLAFGSVSGLLHREQPAGFKAPLRRFFLLYIIMNFLSNCLHDVFLHFFSWESISIFLNWHKHSLGLSAYYNKCKMKRQTGGRRWNHISVETNGSLFWLALRKAPTSCRNRQEPVSPS